MAALACGDVEAPAGGAPGAHAARRNQFLVHQLYPGKTLNYSVLIGSFVCCSWRKFPQFSGRREWSPGRVRSIVISSLESKRSRFRPPRGAGFEAAPLS